MAGSEKVNFLFHKWTFSQESLSLLDANNTGIDTDEPAHYCSLISNLVILFMATIFAKLASCYWIRGSSNKE